MSAFFVGFDHINAMLTAAKALNLYVSEPGNSEDHPRPADTFNPDIWTRIGRALVTANQKSINYLYGSDTEDLFGRNEMADRFTFAEDLHFLTRHKITDAIHLVECFDYQACEHPDWEGSWEKKLCDRLLRAAAGKVPQSGPGSLWEYNKPANAAKIVPLSELIK